MFEQNCSWTASLETLIDQGKTFQTVSADPGWRYEKTFGRAACDKHYSTMTTEEIARLPVKELLAPDALLFLWVTNAHLFEAPKVIEAWGFSYLPPPLIWIKEGLGVGNRLRNCTEILLVAGKGKITWPEWMKDQKNYIRAKRTSRHSEKPSVFRAWIEQVSQPPRLELFARALSPGWTSFGDQLELSLFSTQTEGADEESKETHSE